MSVSSQKGTNTHLAIAQKLVELGYEVLQPFDVQLPYDLAFVVMTSNGWSRSDKPILYRVQCKTGHLTKDGSVVLFNTCGFSGVRKNIRHGYWGEAEYFGVCCPKLVKAYLVPVQSLPEASIGRLRIKKPRNNREAGIHWAKDYEL